MNLKQYLRIEYLIFLHKKHRNMLSVILKWILFATFQYIHQWIKSNKDGQLSHSHIIKVDEMTTIEIR